jgi:hypothetical protein
MRLELIFNKINAYVELVEVLEGSHLQGGSHFRLRHTAVDKFCHHHPIIVFFFIVLVAVTIKEGNKKIR